MNVEVYHNRCIDSISVFDSIFIFVHSWCQTSFWLSEGGLRHTFVNLENTNDLGSSRLYLSDLIDLSVVLLKCLLKRSTGKRHVSFSERIFPRVQIYRFVSKSDSSYLSDTINFLCKYHLLINSVGLLDSIWFVTTSYNLLVTFVE